MLIFIVMLAESGFCDFEQRMTSNRGEYNWPETIANTSRTLPCSFGGFNGTESTAVRLCNESLQEWLQPNLQICFTEVTSDIQRLREVSFSHFL